MKNRLVDYTTIYIVLLIVLLVGIFIGGILDRVFYKKEFTQEIVVKVQPKGYKQYPYYPYHRYFTTLPEEIHLVKIKNGNVVNVERLRYAY